MTVLGDRGVLPIFEAWYPFLLFVVQRDAGHKIISDQSEQMLMSRATSPANRNGFVC
jgi:hypothetical protein